MKKVLKQSEAKLGVMNTLIQALKADLPTASFPERRSKRLLFLLNRKLYSTLITELPKLKDLPPALLNAVREHAEQEYRWLMNYYPTLLEFTLAINGIKADECSRHPHYSLANSLLHIEIIESSGMAVVKSIAGCQWKCPADIERVITLVKKHHKRLSKQECPPETFIAQLHTAYLSALSLQPASPFIPISAVMRNFGTGKTPRDEFTLNFSRLISSRISQHQGKTLQILHSKNDAKGIMLYGLPQRIIIGAIAFLKE